jgi:hypothetical protein
MKHFLAASNAREAAVAGRLQFIPTKPVIHPSKIPSEQDHVTTSPLASYLAVEFEEHQMFVDHRGLRPLPIPVPVGPRDLARGFNPGSGEKGPHLAGSSARGAAVACR